VVFQKNPLVAEGKKNVFLYHAGKAHKCQ